ncbi:MAG: prolipoprotein diacylglyceryl transferase [bacterium]|nr:prolipoprotein diacylglyceryl transferase [bacterium]
MYPVLFKIGSFELHIYGLLLMLSFLLGVYFSMNRAKKEGVDPNKIIDLTIVIMISSLLGARLLYVMFHFYEFNNNLFDIINPFQSDGSIGINGMSILGGVIGASTASFLYLKKQKLPIKKIFNFMVPYVALGIGITRIGCFFQGCCFGKECSSAIGVIFPSNSPAGHVFPGTPLYPSQLFASAAGFIIFGLLLLSRRYDFFKDKTFFIFFVLLGISRFIVDNFRHFESSIIMYQNSIVISSNQIISILMIITGLFFILFMDKLKKSV